MRGQSGNYKLIITATMTQETQENPQKEAKTYKAKAHVATGPFSFLEVDIEGTAAEIVTVNDKLLKKYSEVQK